MLDVPDRFSSCSWTTSSTVSTWTGAPATVSPIDSARAAWSVPSSARTRMASGATSAGACPSPSSVMWRVSRIDEVSGSTPETVTDSSCGPDVTPSSAIVSPTATPSASASSWGSEVSTDSSIMTATSASDHEERTLFSIVSPKACENRRAATMNATDTAIAMPAATRRPDALRRWDRAMRIIGHPWSASCLRRARPVPRPRPARHLR